MYIDRHRTGELTHAKLAVDRCNMRMNFFSVASLVILMLEGINGFYDK